MEIYGFEEALDSLPDVIADLSEEMGHFYIAIDGVSGSGKTTLAERLAEALDAQVIHMDDFYLPLTDRVGERIASPGWNVDYERFAREVARPALDRKPISYGVFDCATQSVRKTVTLSDSRYLIVEGCYAMHPEIPDFYDLRITLSADRALCEKRILERDGEALLRRFQNEWFPLEEEYLQAYMVEELSDIVVTADASASGQGASFGGFEMTIE